MNKPFTLLKQSWDLPEDASLEDLLQEARKRLKNDPDNPEILFAIAEIERHLGDQKAANKQYHDAIIASEERTWQRGDQLVQRLSKKRDHSRARFILLTLAPLIAIALLMGLGWKALNKEEPLPADADPNKFAFTQWLAKQQMVQIMTTLQQQNPELTFDFSRPASTRSQSPMEFMQSLMQPDAIQKLKREQQRAANKKGPKGDGGPAFQCTQEAPVQCSPADIPSAPGERREEVVLLMEAYRSILENEHDCEKLEKSIQSIGRQLDWRKSESRIKADLEDFAVECFYRQKNVAKTIEHARKLQCTGDDGYINSVYWYMTAITYHAGDKEKARTAYQCFKEATAYIEKSDQFGPAYIASRHREAGALAWLYFDDLATATGELEKARSFLKKVRNKTASVLEVAGEIDLDLLETYVTANIDQETFAELVEEINSSGRLTDGYKQIKDALVAIYYLQNHKNKQALVALNNLSSRFKLMPEFICGWDWSGFRRGLMDSIQNDDIRKQAIAIVDAANCYEEIPMNQRIKQSNAVARWLKEH